MRNTVLVGTYHKTGTVWMMSVFQALCKQLQVPFYDISPSRGLCSTKADRREFLIEKIGKREKCVIFENHCRFDLQNLDLSDVKGVRIVRDPRDVCISAARYHPWAQEPWLHIPKEEFGGATYSQVINGLETFKDRLIFEMENASNSTIQKMLDFDDYGVFETIHFEKLMLDVNMLEWHKLSIKMGFDGIELVISQRVFYKKSIFGGATRKRHIQSGSVNQHEEIFSPDLHDIFMQRFPDALDRLQYRT